MSDTPRTDAAICQFRYKERRGDWEGEEVLLYVPPEDCRDIECENKRLREALDKVFRLWLEDANPEECPEVQQLARAALEGK